MMQSLSLVKRQINLESEELQSQIIERSGVLEVLVEIVKRLK